MHLDRAQLRYQHFYRRKIKWFQLLYEFTKDQCQDCARTDCACKDTICANVEREAGKLGWTFAHTGHRLRFIGCQGCVVPPHLRETCTLYLCKPAMESGDFDNERFRRLKEISGRIEWTLMELEEVFGEAVRLHAKKSQFTFFG